MEKNLFLSMGTIFDYIREYYPSLLFWDGFSKHEPREPTKSYKHRAGMPNEIRIEFDSEDKNKNWENINETCINLFKKGYNFAIFYVEGGRSPHIHIYDCDEMDNLTKEQRTIYRKMFLRKFCPKSSNPDLELCDERHLCALEFANHFKYNKPKNLLSSFYHGPVSNQGCDTEIWMKITHEEPKKKPVKKLLKKKRLGNKLKENKRDFILSVLNFEAVFDKYKIEYRGKMALCPFHGDKDKSLSFSNEKGVWHCFGCHAKGDIITLIKMLEEQKNDNKK